MGKKQFEVVRPWYGVKLGEIVEFVTVPRPLLPNVRELVNDKPEEDESEKDESEGSVDSRKRGRRGRLTPAQR